MDPEPNKDNFPLFFMLKNFRPLVIACRPIRKSSISNSFKLYSWLLDSAIFGMSAALAFLWRIGCVYNGRILFHMHLFIIFGMNGTLCLYRPVDLLSYYSVTPFRQSLGMYLSHWPCVRSAMDPTAIKFENVTSLFLVSLNNYTFWI